MRVTIVVRRRILGPQLQWDVSIDIDGAVLTERTMRAWEDDEQTWWPQPATDDPQIVEWTAAIMKREAGWEEAISYGEHLFQSLIGESWDAIRRAVEGVEFVEIALQWPADDAALHRHIWEFMCVDGEFLARRNDQIFGFLHLVGDTGPEPVTIAEVPRILFAASTAMTDPKIHAGAEFIALIRGLNSGYHNGTVSTRTIDAATTETLTESCQQIQPHIVHIASHGYWSPTALRGVIHLRSTNSPAADHPVTATDLLTIMTVRGRLPAAVFLSVCETGTTATAEQDNRDESGEARLTAGDFANSESARPYAAELVSGGVPVVVAMAGRVADSACRMFSRALAAAISNGMPLSLAVARGRHAVFVKDPQPTSKPYKDYDPGSALDWALPTLFVTAALGQSFELVDTTAARSTRQLIDDFSFVNTPLLCGREKFFDLVPRILDPDDPFAVLVTFAKQRKTGGTRLLHELGASVLRAGHVPCYVGFLADPPNTAQALVSRIAQAVFDVRGEFGLALDIPSAALDTLAELAGDTSPNQSFKDRIAILEHNPTLPVHERIRPRRFAGDLKSDLRLLAEDLHAARPEEFRHDAQVVLLLDDVGAYDKATETVFDMIGPGGLQRPDGRKLSVILFGVDDDGEDRRFAKAVESLRGRTNYAQVHEVRMFRDLTFDNDLVAYRQMLLHPEPLQNGPPRHVLVPNRDRKAWIFHIRAAARSSKEVYDLEFIDEVHRFAKGVEGEYFVNDDHALLNASRLNP